MMDNGYEQEPIGLDRVRFRVRPAPVPRSRFVPIALGLLAGMVVVVSSGGLAAAPPALRLAVAVLAGWWTAARVRRVLEARRDRARTPGGTIVISPSGIETNGTWLARVDLDGLSVRNPLLERRRRASRVPGAESNPAAVAVSYALGFGPRDQSTILVGGMTESIALGLLVDVERILRGPRGITARADSLSAPETVPAQNGHARVESASRNRDAASQRASGK
jgi:hypothetical protein